MVEKEQEVGKRSAGAVGAQKPWSAVVKASQGVVDAEEKEVSVVTPAQQADSSHQGDSTGTERQGVESVEKGEEKKVDKSTAESPEVGEQQQEKKKNKPAWNIDAAAKPEEVPIPEAVVSWPSLVDSKEPLPKKKQREQAAAAAAAMAASKSESSAPSEQQGKGKNSKKNRKGGNKQDQKDDAPKEGNKQKSGSKGHRGKKGYSGDDSQEGGKKGKGSRGRHGYGGHKGGGQQIPMATMPYGVPQMMYPTAPGVFYPPAAYGMPANVGMTNVESVMTAVRNQIDYYFSPQNLAKDLFLRSKMDAHGWVELAIIAAFNRVRMLTPDLTIIYSALSSSSVVELSDDGMFLRARDGYEQWVLDESQRDPNIKSPEPPAVDSKASTSDKNKKSALVKNLVVENEEGAREEDDVFQLDEEHQDEAGADSSKMTDDEISRLIVVKPSNRKKKESSNLSSVGDMKAVINDGLELYGQELRKTAEHRSGSKTVSNPQPMANGNKHAKYNVNANFYPASLGQSFNGRPKSLGKDVHSRPSVAVGWVLGSTPGDASFMSPGSRKSGSHLGSSAPIQKFQHPSYQLLEENGFTQMKYKKFHDRCIEERAQKGVGLSEEMNTLFRFWCYFLRDNFNDSMYEDFKKYALDDSEQGYHYGIECLFRFYSYGLEAQFSKKIYKEFEEFVLKDQEAGQLYGLEKFWAYHHYHGLPENSGIKMHPKLAHLLETEYTSIDDFKAKRENQKQHQ
ncbi:hypothetical protein M9434_000341 [Picochlorum sp. BPE23]|nr:hypothetical protein M9434_000341 [Picochlorum sp. BPE23]